MNLHLCFCLGLFFIFLPSKGLSLEKESKVFKLPVVTKNPLLLQQFKKKFGEERISKQNLQKFLIQNSYYQYKIVQKAKVYVVKKPIQTIFIIKGANFWTEKHIRKLIKIDERNLGPSFYSFVETAIRDSYQKQGFLKVSIKSKKVRKDWREWLYLNISEGPRIKIAEIKVKGLFSRPASEYESFIKNNSSDLIREGFYSKKDLENSYTLLLDRLRGEGYLQSKIYSDRVFFKKDKAFIVVQLEEGPLILIKDIQIQNTRAVPVWEILSLLGSRTQAPLKMETLQEDLDKIEEFYKSKGWLNAKITNRGSVVQYSPGDPYVSILISIDEGRKARVWKISFKGLKKTKKEAALALLNFKPGDILTSSKKQKSLKALGETGLFSTINWNEKFDEGRFEVEITPRERKPRSLRGSVGFHTERGIASRAWLEVLQRNLFGYGRSLSARGDGQATLAHPISLSEPKTFFTYKVSSRYREVFSPGKGWSGDLSLSRAKNVFKYDVDNISFIQKTKVSFFINKKIMEDLKAKWNLWSFENRSELCSREDCPENPQRIASSGFNFVWDKRDNIFDPSKGRLNSLALELAAPFLGGEKQISFFRLDSHNHWHWSLFKDYSFSLGLKAGWIQALGGKRHIPVSKAFILGGKFSIRGYEGYIEGDRVPHAGIAPIESANEALKLSVDSSVKNEQEGQNGELSVEQDTSSRETLKSVLKSRYGLISLDFRFPVFEGFKGSLFYDLGVVDLQSSAASRLDYGHSVGLGLRYQTFLIPIGMDIAYKLPRKTGEKDYRWHVSIGW